MAKQLGQAALAAASGLGSGFQMLGNMWQANQQNEWNRQSEQDARDFNYRMWTEMNAYNHPSEQMKRLREAGLNPYMVYGSSPSSATGNTTGMDRANAAEISKINPFEYTPNPLDGLQKAAVTSNLREQNKLIEADVAFRNTQAISEASRNAGQLIANAKGQFDLDLAKDLRETSFQASKANLENLRRQNTRLELENRFADQTLAARANEIIQRVEMAKAALKGQELRNKLDELEYDWMKLGLTKTDPIWARALGRVTNEAIQEATGKNKGGSLWQDSVQLFNQIFR